MQGVIIPVPGDIGARRQGQGDNGHVIDAPADDQRLGDAQRHAVHIGADPLMDAQDGSVRAGADLEPGGDQDLVVLGQGVDMLDRIDRADDRFERFSDQLDGACTARVRSPRIAR